MHISMVAALLLLLVLTIPSASGFAFLPPLLLTRPKSAPLLRMSLSKVSFSFDFHRIPYAAGIQHIHSPEHIAETHRFGAPFFRIDSVSKPDLRSTEHVSITFTCSTLFIQAMRVRMFSRQPNESNLLFFKDGRALYGVKFTVIPLRGCAHLHNATHLHDPSHRLRLDVTFFTGTPAFRATLKSLLPLFMFVNAMEDQVGYTMPVHENANFTEYRHGVLRGDGSDKFWLMAERVRREYTP